MPYTKGERAKQKNQQFREQQEAQYEGEGNEQNAGRNDVVNTINCSVPTGCLMEGEPVNICEPGEVAKVVCNNPDCDIEYMHKVCFGTWEDEVLTYLRSSGRARSWSEKQRRQNLWTKKGFDLAWKACSCKCGKGHLRKDLNWIPPRIPDEQRKIRRKKKSGDHPSVGIKSPPVVGSLGSRLLQRQSSTSSTENYSPPSSADNMRGATRKTPNNTFTSFEFPPPGGYGNSDSSRNIPATPRERRSTSASPTRDDLHTYTPAPRMANAANSNTQHFAKNNNNIKLNAGVHFLRRLDFTSFQSVLPKHKLNPYHIRMEEDNDDIRAFILSTLSAHETTYIICTLCGQQLPVFDKYPLIDGTFFLTPQRHTDGCLQVFLENKSLHLSAVCVNCLEGAQSIICRSCKCRWDGSHHQLGTMYKYDIFAARPCCSSRLACKHCGQPVIDIRQATNFYSDYSQSIQCPHCSVSDFHFVKPLSSYELIQHC